jgi:hypothetical protein
MAMESKEFELSELVRLAMSDEQGTVIGKAVYAESPTQYLVRYKAADGRQVENWWSEQALVHGHA